MFSFTLLLFCIEKFVFCQKTYLEKLIATFFIFYTVTLLRYCYVLVTYCLYCCICIRVFFAWQFIGNTVTKHQRPYRYALFLQTAYFERKYLAIDQYFKVQKCAYIFPYEKVNLSLIHPTHITIHTFCRALLSFATYQ